MIIRDATLSDIEQLVVLENTCFSDPWSKDSLISQLNSPFRSTLVAEDEGLIVGYISGCTIPPETEIYKLATLPQMRKKGIGTALLASFQTKLFYSSHSTLFFLEVRKSNTNAISLYEKDGFQCEGVRNNYYSNPLEDALLFSKQLKEEESCTF